MEVMEKSPSLAAVEKKYEETAQLLDRQSDGFPNCSKLNRRKTVYKFLEIIIENAGGCDNYYFILFLTKLEGKYGSDLTPSLWEILNDYMLSPESDLSVRSHKSDVAFAALYNLIHHYYRAKDTNNLAELCGNNTGYLKLFFNMEYYLTVELFQRYMSILGRTDVQYRMCLLLNKYVETGVLPPSAALNAAFVNAVCELCNKKFREEKRKHFYPEKGVKARLNDSLFLKALDNFSSGKRYNFDLGVVADWKVALQTALKLVDKAISFNQSYPKYHYLKAQVLFYTHLLSVGSNKDDGDDEVYEQVFDEVTVAEQYENKKAADYNSRIATYKNFEAAVMEYRDRRSGQVTGNSRKNRLMREYGGIFLSDEIPPASERPPFDTDVKDFVFISYSSRDFKPVYRDIIELLGENVGLWYDREAQLGESWENTIREKIRTCKCVICYISENAITSQPIIDELRYAKQYNKQVIGVNLTHNRIATIISEAEARNKGGVTSDALKIFVETFEDEITVIMRNPRVDYTGHILKLIAFLNDRYPSVIPRISSDCLSAKNSIDGKPNEDFCVADEKLHIYAVADGISRSPAEYEGAHALIAREVSETFCTQFVKKLKISIQKSRTSQFKDGGEICRDISEAFKAANAETGKLIESRWDGSGEKPGCVAVVAIIADRTLYFGNVGDCVGILVRDGRQIIFAGKQTRYAFDIAGVESDRDKLAAEYVNRTENRYGYGVINGEEQAAKFLRVSHIVLEPGDVVYLMSDGLSDYVEFAESSSYLSQSLEEIERASRADHAALRGLENSVVRDYDDDRTIIKINFR